MLSSRPERFGNTFPCLAFRAFRAPNSGDSPEPYRAARGRVQGAGVPNVLVCLVSLGGGHSAANLDQFAGGGARVPEANRRAAEAEDKQKGDRREQRRYETIERQHREADTLVACEDQRPPVDRRLW